jgi:hypothetical protein
MASIEGSAAEGAPRYMKSPYSNVRTVISKLCRRRLWRLLTMRSSHSHLDAANRLDPTRALTLSNRVTVYVTKVESDRRAAIRLDLASPVGGGRRPTCGTIASQRCSLLRANSFERKCGAMPTSLPPRRDSRPRDETAGRLVAIFVIASVSGFVAWCVADHVTQHLPPLVSYASTAPNGQGAPR